MSFIRFAEVLVRQNNRGEAQQYFDQGLGIMERLTRQDPSNAGWENDVAWIKTRMTKLKE